MPPVATPISLAIQGQEPFRSDDPLRFPPLNLLDGSRFDHNGRGYRIRVLDAQDLRFEASVICPTVHEVRAYLRYAWRCFLNATRAIFGGTATPWYADKPGTNGIVAASLHNWALSNRVLCAFDEQASTLADQLLSPDHPEIRDRYGQLIINNQDDHCKIEEAALQNWLEDRIADDPCNRLVALTRAQHQVLVRKYANEAVDSPHASIKAALLKLTQSVPSENHASFHDWVRSLPLASTFTDDQIDAMDAFLHTTDLTVGEDAPPDRVKQVQDNVARFRMQLIALCPDLIRLHRAADSKRLTRELTEPGEHHRPGAKMMGFAQPHWRHVTGSERLKMDERLEPMSERCKSDYENIVHSGRPQDVYTLALVATARELFWRINDLQRMTRQLPSGHIDPHDTVSASAGVAQYTPEMMQFDAAAMDALRTAPMVGDYLVTQADHLIRNGIAGRGTAAPVLRPSELDGITIPSGNGVAELERATHLVRLTIRHQTF